LREAHEEISLPLASPHVQVLCHLHPFFSAARLLVTPIVAFLSDTSVLEGLRASETEVAHIFSHPLEAILDPELARAEVSASAGSEDWPYEEELYVRATRSLS
jgi:coenzyme A diphosphatase NUDT7